MKTPARETTGRDDTPCERHRHASRRGGGPKRRGTESEEKMDQFGDCRACAAEIETHAALRDALGGLPAFEASPREVRAERDALLERAEALVERPANAKLWRACALVGAAVLAVAVVLSVHAFPWTPQVPSEAAGRVVPGPPDFDVVTDDGADFRSSVDGGTVRHRLASGTATFHVAHLERDQRFLVELPDGEIEVRGTRFVVRVSNGVTESVYVLDGIVALRREGSAPLLLRAGDRWPAAPAPPERSTGADDDAEMKKDAREGTKGERAPPANVFTGRATSSASAAASSDERFAVAMSAFSAGSYERADDLFRRFEVDFPNDRRSEDAAFLRAVARDRSGDHAGAARLAREYLAAHPHGLRTKEAESLAAQPSAP